MEREKVEYEDEEDSRNNLDGTGKTLMEHDK